MLLFSYYQNALVDLWCVGREHTQMQMEAEDLLEKARDIQMMKVTKDLLQRLHEEDLFSKDIREKETLDKTIKFNTKV